MRQLHDLSELFVEQLKEQYDGERQQVESLLPQMRAKTSTKALQQSIDHHIGKTRNHLKRLKNIFTLLGRNSHGEVNIGVKGLIEESFDLVKRCVDKEVRDAGIVTAIQHLNHHNIASYGTLTAYAKVLGMEDIQDLLKQCLDEEKATDKNLSVIAEISINYRAIH